MSWFVSMDCFWLCLTFSMLCVRMLQWLWGLLFGCLCFASMLMTVILCKCTVSGIYATVRIHAYLLRNLCIFTPSDVGNNLVYIIWVDKPVGNWTAEVIWHWLIRTFINVKLHYFYVSPLLLPEPVYKDRCGVLHYSSSIQWSARSWLATVTGYFRGHVRVWLACCLHSWLPFTGQPPCGAFC